MNKYRIEQQSRSVVLEAENLPDALWRADMLLPDYAYLWVDPEWLAIPLSALAISINFAIQRAVTEARVTIAGQMLEQINPLSQDKEPDATTNGASMYRIFQNSGHIALLFGSDEHGLIIRDPYGECNS